MEKKIIYLCNEAVKLNSDEEAGIYKIIHRIRKIQDDTGFGSLEIFIQNKKISVLKSTQTEKGDLKVEN